ncbi:hypothetical protein ACF3N7_02165 [Cruoricaptor ignavus]|uniref:hypothetical protein n=1 Tax=Cruoricaptor ignavus TaxID=1118202 RepID=UPI00370D2501
MSCIGTRLQVEDFRTAGGDGTAVSATFSFHSIRHHQAERVLRKKLEKNFVV